LIGFVSMPDSFLTCAGNAGRFAASRMSDIAVPPSVAWL
jgi:hypothetical protein